MKAIILAAGYGTRLSKGLKELKKSDKEKFLEIKGSIKGKHKALVELDGRPLIDYTVENITRAGIEDVYVITNRKFFKSFNNWKKDYDGAASLTIIDDKTRSNEKRLGAAGDLQYLLRKEEINDDAIVLGGDNLFTVELNELVELYNQKKGNILLVYKEDKKERIKRSSRVRFDANNHVTFFEEKPSFPESEEWVCPPCYIYTADALGQIKIMDISKERKDNIGNIQVMLYKEKPFYAYPAEGINGIVRFDLGSIDDYDKAVEYIKSLEKK